MILRETQTRISTLNNDLLTVWCALEALRGETGDDESDAEITKAMRCLDAANNALIRAEFPHLS